MLLTTVHVCVLLGIIHWLNATAQNKENEMPWAVDKIFNAKNCFTSAKWSLSYCQSLLFAMVQHIMQVNVTFYHISGKHCCWSLMYNKTVFRRKTIACYSFIKKQFLWTPRCAVDFWVRHVFKVCQKLLVKDTKETSSKMLISMCEFMLHRVVRSFFFFDNHTP